jgi:hypothetical protein
MSGTSNNYKTKGLEELDLFPSSGERQKQILFSESWFFYLLRIHKASYSDNKGLIEKDLE